MISDAVKSSRGSASRQTFSDPRRPGRQSRRKAPDVASVELWVPTRLDATIPLTDALWLKQAFPTAKELEAFTSTVLVMAVAEVRKGGDANG
ncbi:hypothetical protein Pan44_28120 [Caulifigura coniformis]|uniref:Uncharacterized protein n=1 Tax=Caulifigura coniformis TaxID=2527983 RepID=A0A517SF59_9PLAN|nr:hypothetical protein Pan44_28120 [Caulifigura coniformis]